MADDLTIDLGTLVDWTNEADDATNESRQLSEKCRDYYDSRQWQDSEVRKLKKQKQAATVINRVKPKMDGLMGMEKQNRTTAKAYPRTPKHEKGAEAATEATRFVLQDNFYNEVRSSAFGNLLVEGTGGVEVIVKPTNNGEQPFQIIINQVMWDRIIYDQHSRRKDFSDARYLGQVVWLDYDEAVARYPKAKDVIESMVSGSSTYDDKPRWMDTSRRRVKLVEMYYHKDGNVWYACFTRGGFCEAPKKSPYVNEEGETEWPYEYGSLFVGREGDRYGAMAQLLDVQDEINKRRSKALHLMSVRQVRWERGAVEDINKARDELAKPDGVLETTPGMEFEVLKTGDMAAAQFQLLTEAKQEIDSVSYNAAASGKDQNLQSGVALRAREAAGQTEVAPIFDVLKHMDIRVYRKVWNRIKQYWKSEMWIRVTDDDINLRWVGLNRPMTQGQLALENAKAAGMPPEQLQALQQQLAMDPMAQQPADLQNDIANLDVDIVMADAPDTVTQQVQDFQTLGEMVKSGFQMPPMAVIEASPLSNKHKIMKMMKEAPQLSPQHQQQMEQMQEAMEEAKQHITKLAEENQALKQDQQTEMMKIGQKQQADQQALDQKKFAQQEEMRLERERFEFEKQLAFDKQNLEIQLQDKKQTSEETSAKRKMDFEIETKQRETDMMIEQENEKKQKDVLPKLEQNVSTALEKMSTDLSQLLAQMIDVQKQTLAALEKPRSVRIADVQRAPDGQLLGATVQPTMVQ